MQTRQRGGIMWSAKDQQLLSREKWIECTAVSSENSLIGQKEEGRAKENQKIRKRS